jgi:hypothetical protein
VEITKIQFNTLTDPAALDIQSRFTMWGYLNFGTMIAPAINEVMLLIRWMLFLLGSHQIIMTYGKKVSIIATCM